jgi:uncharacterized membrane protein
MRRWLFYLIQIANRLWVRTVLFTLAALVAAVAAWAIGTFVPPWLGETLGGKAVERLLSILASSMLVIATFSLGTMVSAHQAVSSLATPRVAPMLSEGSAALHAISTFAGTFVFSLTTLIALDTGLIAPGGRALLFILSILVTSIVVITLVRWVDEVSRLGQIHDTLGAIERNTRTAIDSDPLSRPGLGFPYESLPEGFDVMASQVGFVQTVDYDEMAEAVAGSGLHVYMRARPGTYCHRYRPLCRLVVPDPDGHLDARAHDSDARERMRRLGERVSEAFVIGPRRTILQDPRYGFTLMGEVAAKALSPGVNDPGTAIDAIVSATRTLDHWYRHNAGKPDGVRFEWLHASAISFHDLAPHFLDTLIHHGGDDPRVMRRLIKGLDAVAALDQNAAGTLRQALDDAQARWRNADIPAHEREALDAARRQLEETRGL